MKDCPNLAFSLEYKDGGAIDPEIFTQYSKVLKIYTADITKIGIYLMRLTVYFSSDSVTYDNAAQLSFTVEIKSGTGDLARPPLLVENCYLNAQGILTLQFNFPLAVPERYKNLEDL